MKLAEMTSPEVDRLSRDTPVVIPLAAVEQHGPHLPLITDSALLGAIVDRVQNTEIAAQILFAPLQWLGNSHHHLDFPGTLSAAPRTYLDLVTSLVENVLYHGFRRILVLNGHGGNDVPGKQSLFELRQAHRDRTELLFLFSTYWSLGTALDQIPALSQSDMGHACEWETSMMLSVAPELVKDFQHLPEISPGNPFRPASRSWVTQDRSQSGYIGDPAVASVEKGNALLDNFVAGLESMLERMVAWDGSSWDG